MKSKTMIAVIASFMGLVSGVIGANLIEPAHAASDVVVVDYPQILTQCDFTKTIVFLNSVGFACVRK